MLNCYIPTPENSESFSCHIQNRGNVGHGMRDGGQGMQFLTYHRIASRYPKDIHIYLHVGTYTHTCTNVYMGHLMLLANIIRY